MSGARVLPTHPCICIRGAHEAYQVLEAVRLNRLPLARHRLGHSERENLCAGQVFVWCESTSAEGLERWTDGRKWSASKTRDVFLIYEEKDIPSADEKLQKVAKRIDNYFFPPSPTVENGPLRTPPPSAPSRRRDRPTKPDGLLKQTFSAWVTDPIDGTKMKWHISAYLPSTGWAGLPTVPTDPILRKIQVPPGIFEFGTTVRIRRQPSSHAKDRRTGGDEGGRPKSVVLAESRPSDPGVFMTFSSSMEAYSRRSPHSEVATPISPPDTPDDGILSLAPLSIASSPAPDMEQRGSTLYIGTPISNLASPTTQSYFPATPPISVNSAASTPVSVDSWPWASNSYFPLSSPAEIPSSYTPRGLNVVTPLTPQDDPANFEFQRRVLNQPPSFHLRAPDASKMIRHRVRTRSDAETLASFRPTF